MQNTQRQYVLGTEEAELARLRLQAETIAPASELILDQVGIAEGMRALELGTGLGHLASVIARRVGASGSVVALDRSPTMVAAAKTRVRDAGYRKVVVEEGDVTSWEPPGRFDVIVARLLFIHLADPLAVLHRLQGALESGGALVVIDFDIGAFRDEPATPLFTSAHGWILAAFRHLGLNPAFGATAHRLLAEAGYQNVHSFGVVPILEADTASRLIAGILGTLAPVITDQLGLVSAEELGLTTLQQRIHDEMTAADAVCMHPTVTGTWGRIS